MASNRIRNPAPFTGLRVRVPCPPLSINDVTNSSVGVGGVFLLARFLAGFDFLTSFGVGCWRTVGCDFSGHTCATTKSWVDFDKLRPHFIFFSARSHSFSPYFEEDLREHPHFPVLEENSKGTVLCPIQISPYRLMRKHDSKCWSLTKRIKSLLTRQVPSGSDSQIY